MATYSVKLYVYNSARPDFPAQTIRLKVSGLLGPLDALSKVQTIYVSRNGRRVTTTGGVGADGYSYPEWLYRGARKIA